MTDVSEPNSTAAELGTTRNCMIVVFRKTSSLDRWLSSFARVVAGIARGSIPKLSPLSDLRSKYKQSNMWAR